VCFSNEYTNLICRTLRAEGAFLIDAHSVCNENTYCELDMKVIIKLKYTLFMTLDFALIERSFAPTVYTAAVISIMVV